MTNNNGTVRSLYQITEYPLDLSHTIYQEYPFMKLGVSSSVQYYAERLALVVEEIMSANPEYTSWVLTSPPSHKIPAAANLLCWDIYERLINSVELGVNISVIDLFNTREGEFRLENAQDFSNYNDYSKFTWEDRLKLKRKHSFVIKAEDFHNRGIVFINDINVTGTGHEYIRQIFAEVYPDEVNWLYIIDCDKSIGRRVPQLESEINNFKANTLFEFGAMLARGDIRHTAKCISKIFTYSTVELEQLIGMLGPNQKSKLLEAILAEDLYHGDLFKEKMAVIRARV